MSSSQNRVRLQAQINRNILIVRGQGDRGERRGEISERCRNRCGGRESLSGIDCRKLEREER